jgi:hypothetical protein
MTAGWNTLLMYLLMSPLTCFGLSSHEFLCKGFQRRNIQLQLRLYFPKELRIYVPNNF